jgi:hypothetical protein
MYIAMLTALPQNSSSKPCARIMLLAHSMMVVSARSATPFCCGE